MTTTIFQELALPGGSDVSWVVRVVGDEALYLLNHTNHLGDLIDYDDDEFRFSSELNACNASYRFYEHHGAMYPHLRWLIKLLSDEIDILTKQSSGSKVMEFIMYPHLRWLIKLLSDEIDILTKQSSGSKVMEFI